MSNVETVCTPSLLFFCKKNLRKTENSDIPIYRFWQLTGLLSQNDAEAPTINLAKHAVKADYASRDDDADGVSVAVERTAETIVSVSFIWRPTAHVKVGVQREVSIVPSEVVVNRIVPGLDISPIINGLSRLREQKSLPIKGIRGRFKGLPPFVADSLPDRWGSKVFASWCQQQKINTNEITPLDFLLYLGKRGMGALEFEPAYDLDAKGSDIVNVFELFHYAQAILQGRLDMRLTIDDALSLRRTKSN